MSSSARMGVVVVLATIFGVARGADAQVAISPVQELGAHAPETWALRYYTAITQITGFGTPEPTHLGALKAQLELGNIPYLSTEQRTVGFDGTTLEDLNHSRVFGRVSVGVGLPANLTFSVHYTPPVTISGVKTNLWGATLGGPLIDVADFRLGLTALGQLGNAQGAFTCSADDVAGGADVNVNPLGCQQTSHDEVLMNYLGLELAASYRIAPLAGLEPFVSIAGSRYFNRFEVNALYNNITDTTQLWVNTWNVSGTAGLGLPLGRWIRVSAEVFYAPLPIDRLGSTESVNDGLVNARGLFEVHTP